VRLHVKRDACGIFRLQTSLRGIPKRDYGCASLAVIPFGGASTFHNPLLVTKEDCINGVFRLQTSLRGIRHLCKKPCDAGLL